MHDFNARNAIISSLYNDTKKAVKSCVQIVLIIHFALYKKKMQNTFLSNSALW